MSLAELMPAVRGLPREDKLTLLRQLSDELTAEDPIPPGVYPVWSQIDRQRFPSGWATARPWMRTGYSTPGLQ